MSMWYWILGGAAALWLLSKKSEAKAITGNPATALMNDGEQLLATLIREAVYTKPTAMCKNPSPLLAVKFTNVEGTKGVLSWQGASIGQTTFTLSAPPADDALTKADAQWLAEDVCR